MKPAKSLENTAAVVVKPACVATAEDIADFMPLVHQIVARFLRKLPPNVLRDDLVAAGTFGLIDALRKGGDDKGVTFEWYARVRIRGAILDELRSQDWLTRRARTRLTQNAAKEGDTSSQSRVAVVGLDDLPFDVHSQGIHDTQTPSPLAIVEERMEHKALAAAVERLPERERYIVTSHYFQQIPFKAIAQTLGVSEPRISQLHSRAMGLLRGEMKTTQDERAA
jgi:RNA polymerase sigma factor for flagellar operon FliA